MKVLDTTNSLDARAKDVITTTLLNKYYGEYDKYPNNAEGVIIRPLGIDAYEAELVISGDNTITLNFSGKRLKSRAVKLPNRDLNDKNIR